MVRNDSGNTFKTTVKATKQTNVTIRKTKASLCDLNIIRICNKYKVKRGHDDLTG